MHKVLNPSNGETIEEVQTDTPGQIRDKVERARDELPVWAGVPLANKKTAVARFGALLTENIESLARTLTAETGKPITQAKEEVGDLGASIDFFLEHIDAILQEEVPLQQEGLEERITHEPLGVVANISAWNFPYFTGCNVFLPALLTGNTVVYKPSEFALLTGLQIVRLLTEAGVSPDAFVPVLGTGEAGARLMEQDLDAVFFTGSYATGSQVAAAAAKRLLKVQLELGGKDPVYVADDADPAAAAASLVAGAFDNNGQSCCAVERLYVHEKIFPAFVEAFVTAVRDFKIGDPLDPDTYIGPLTRPQQIPVLEAQIKDALHKGGRILCGGKRLDQPGNYFEPTVITQINPAMTLMREETFGPLIGIQSVPDDEKAVRRINDNAYGLTAGVYTPSRERALGLLKRCNAGTVYWNCCDRVSPRLPWSGRKHSGRGVTLSKDGIRTFLQPKAWHLKSA